MCVSSVNKFYLLADGMARHFICSNFRPNFQKGCKDDQDLGDLQGIRPAKNLDFCTKVTKSSFFWQ
jgi:hypothetical protein